MAGTESAGHPGVVAGRNTTTEKPDDIGMDQDSRALFCALWAWSVGDVEWQKVDLNAKLDTIIAHLAQIETNTTP